MRALALLGLAAVTAALSGCAATPGAATAAAMPAPSVSVSPSPMRVITLPVPAATSPAPALRNTGTAWMPILTSLSAYGQWLLANPDPALVGTVATPGCAAANLLSDQLDGLLGSRAYVKTAPAAITSVLGPSPATGNEVTLQVIASRPAEPVVNRANGTTISTFGAYPQSALDVTLDLGTDKHWRLCAVENTADAGATDDPSVPLI